MCAGALPEMSSITVKMCTPATILINAARQHSFFAKLITLALYIFGVFEGCFRALVVTRMSLPIRAIVNFVTKDPEVFLGAARNVRTLFCPPKQGQKGKCFIFYEAAIFHSFLSFLFHFGRRC